MAAGWKWTHHRRPAARGCPPDRRAVPPARHHGQRLRHLPARPGRPCRELERRRRAHQGLHAPTRSSASTSRVFYPAEERAARAAGARAAAARARRPAARTRAGACARTARASGPTSCITALRDEPGELRGFAKVTRDMTAAPPGERAHAGGDVRAHALRRGDVRPERALPGASIRRSCASLATARPSSRQRTVGDLTHPEDVQRTWRIFEELVQGKRSHADFESRMLRRNGQAIWVRNDRIAPRRRGRTPALHHRHGRGHHRPAVRLRGAARKRGAPAGVHQAQPGAHVPQGRRGALPLRQRALPAALRPAPGPDRGAPG